MYCRQCRVVLKEWYEDHDLYHKIGYLIASKSQSVASLYEFSKEKTKREFKSGLDSLICESIAFNKKYEELKIKY